MLAPSTRERTNKPFFCLYCKYLLSYQNLHKFFSILLYKLHVAIEKYCYDTNGVTTIYILLSVHLGCAWVWFSPLSLAVSD